MQRNLEEWRQAVNEDISIIAYQLKESAREETVDRALHFALALKEARRLQNDIYRIASEIFDIDRKTIDDVGPL